MLDFPIFLGQSAVSFSRVFGLEESNERRMFTLENPNRYPEGQGPIPIQILEGRSPEGFGLE